MQGQHDVRAEPQFLGDGKECDDLIKMAGAPGCGRCNPAAFQAHLVIDRHLDANEGAPLAREKSDYPKMDSGIQASAMA